MKRRVALIVETSSTYGRDLLSGILRFMRLHDEWSVFLEQRDLWQQPPTGLNHWTGDGIISRATTPRLLEAISKTGVPLVDVTDRHNDLELPQVRSDDSAIGRLAAQHLYERGFRRFGFCGFKREAWSHRRQTAFMQWISAHVDTPCECFNSAWSGPTAQSWDDEQKAITSWLKKLQPPFAVMACNDIRGQHVIESCSNLGLAVPEQAAVIGVDNDELLCRVCSPPLSSVIPNASAVGFRAAELLSSLMKGTSIAQSLQVVEPLGIATRQSTDVVAIEDREVAAALHYIREHACKGLSVAEVVRNNAISRSTLERQLRKYLGRTPQEEIRNVQIKRATELLHSTELSMEKVAALCGFEHPEYFYVVFKRIMGMTPLSFRNRSLSQTSPKTD